MSHKKSTIAEAEAGSVAAPGGLYFLTLPDGRLLAFDLKGLEDALIAGAPFMPASAIPSPATAPEQYLTAAQTAALFGVNKRLIEDLARNDIILSYAVGRFPRFLISELKDFFRKKARFRKAAAVIP
jgi:hypothetical protein